MNRFAIILFSALSIAQSQDENSTSSPSPAPIRAFFTLPFLPTLPEFDQPTILPTLPPFTPPTLPSLIMTFKSPVAVRVPLLEEIQTAMENSFNNVSTTLNNIGKDNQDKLNSIVKGNQDSLNNLVKSGQDNINNVAKSNQESIAAIHKLTQDTIDKVLITPQPLGLEQFTLIPLPPPLKSQSRDGKSAETVEAPLTPKSHTPAAQKIDSIRKVGRYYVENLTPQHVLDILSFKKPLLTPEEIAVPTHEPVAPFKVCYSNGHEKRSKTLKEKEHLLEREQESLPTAPKYTSSQEKFEGTDSAKPRRHGRQERSRVVDLDEKPVQPASKAAAVGRVPDVSAAASGSLYHNSKLL